MFAYSRNGVAVIVFLIMSGLVACSNPAEDEDEEHAEVEGLVLVLGGEEVVRVAEAEVTGSLTVDIGGEATSDITVGFLDHDGDEVHGEDLDSEFNLRVDIQGGQLVTVSHTGRWTFTLQQAGSAEGSTAIRVLLMHGDHADFTTPDISVTVE